MVSKIETAIGLLQAISVAFPAWLVVSQLVLRRTKMSDSVDMSVWEEGGLHALIVSSYGALVFIIQKIYQSLLLADISSSLLDAVVWFRTWATISAIVVVLIMTRDRGFWYMLGVLLGGMILAAFFNLFVGFDMGV